MDRRDFLRNAALTGAALAVSPAIFESLGIGSLKAATRSTGVATMREIPLRLEDTPELKKIGGMFHLEIEEIDKNLLVVRVEENKFVTVNIKCTHKGCDVAYKGPTVEKEEEKEDDGKLKVTKESQPMFVCPCHSSTFDLTGAPVSGPAKKPLGNYETIFKDGEVIIKIPAEGETAPADCTKK